MNRLVLNTSHGRISVVGHIHLDVPRPSLLVISGAFPPEDYKHELHARFPGANVLIGLYPGMLSRPFKDPRPEIVSAAYDEVIALLFRDQPIVAYGISTGCLVTTGLKSPNIRRHVLQEPFFSTAGLWPFFPHAREILTNEDNPDLRRFLLSVFGITHTTVEDRDYAHLLDGLDAPTDVLVGQIPLEVPRAPVWPSFVSAADRRALAARPNVRIFEGPPGSGHHMEATPEGEDLVLRVVRSALLSVIKPAP